MLLERLRRALGRRVLLDAGDSFTKPEPAARKQTAILEIEKRRDLIGAGEWNLSEIHPSGYDLARRKPRDLNFCAISHLISRSKRARAPICEI